MKPEQTAQPKLYIGINIRKRSWKVHCATDLFFEKSFTMPLEPKVLEAYVHPHFLSYEVSIGCEGGCCGQYALRSFEGFGWSSLAVNPAEIHRKGKECFTKSVYFLLTIYRI